MAEFADYGTLWLLALIGWTAGAALVVWAARQLEAHWHRRRHAYYDGGCKHAPETCPLCRLEREYHD